MHNIDVVYQYNEHNSWVLKTTILWLSTQLLKYLK